MRTLRPGENGAPASGQAPGTTQVIPGVPGTESLGPLSAPEKKLDAALIAISRAHAAGGNARARVAAKTELVTVERDRARVEVTCASNAAVANVRALIVRRGGAVLSTFENKAFAWVPFGAVARLASDERVWSLAVSRQAFGPAGTPTP